MKKLVIGIEELNRPAEKYQKLCNSNGHIVGYRMKLNEQISFEWENHPLKFSSDRIMLGQAFGLGLSLAPPRVSLLRGEGTSKGSGAYPHSILDKVENS